MYFDAALVRLAPNGVVTTTSTWPAAPAGATAVNCDDDTSVTEVAGTAPNLTVAPVRLVPLMVTVVPPPRGPEVGVIDATVGGTPKLSSVVEPQPATAAARAVE